MKKAVESQEKKPTRRELLEQWKEARSSMTTPKKFTQAAPKPARFEDLLRSDDRILPHGDPTFRFKLGKLSMSKSVVSSVKKLSTAKQFDWLDYKEIPTLSSRLERAFGSELRFPQFTSDAGKMEECQVTSFQAPNEIAKGISFPRAMKVEMSRLTEIQNEISMKDSLLEGEDIQNNENRTQESNFEVEEKGKQGNLVEERGSKPPSCSKKRKDRGFGDEKENDVVGMERQGLKKVLLNENPEKLSCSKTEQIKLDFTSGMKNLVQEPLKSLNIIEKVTTPLRNSQALVANTPIISLRKLSTDKISSENESSKFSKPSVRFSDQPSEVFQIEKNNVDDMLKPLDDITMKLREMIKKRQPTPYSKSTEKLEDEDEAGNENFRLRDESKDSKVKRAINMGDLDVRGSELYNVMELKEVSAKKKGPRDVFTPFKDITNDRGESGTAGVNVLPNNEENIELLRKNSDVTKRLESFY